MQESMITIGTDAYGRSKELSAFVCDPSRKPLAQINGLTKFDIAYKFNDISTVDFEVSRYIENASTHEIEENLAYGYIHSFCEIYIPEFGERAYFIVNEEPRITAESTMKESKIFTASSYESVLMYENLVMFEINQGTETSREIWEETEGQYSFLEPVRLYYPANEKLSLLHLVIKDDYYGWNIGYVDASLVNLQRAFSIDNKNVYAFLREDVCTAFRCVIEFDSVNKLINVFDIETVGTNTGIYIGFENFLSRVSTAPKTADIYTVFNVSGADDLDIAQINFGSNKIYDISYPLSMCDRSLGAKWTRYESIRSGLRESYASYAIQYADILEKLSSIMDRQPDDIVTNNWSSPLFTLDELREELEYARWYINEIMDEYRDEYGHVDWDALNLSKDADVFYSFYRIAIPDLTAEIAARESGEPYSAVTVNQEYIWQVYGLHDLYDEQKKITECIQLYIDGGFSADHWEPSMNIDQVSWAAKHQMYLDLLAKQVELNAYVADFQSKADELESDSEDLLEDMQDVAEQASLEHHTGYGKLFSEEEAAIIRSLFRESDYQDENYLLTDYDDAVSSVSVREELYDAAEKRLAIESKPQITWSVETADLFNIEEFKPLRDSLQIGDFITLGFGEDAFIPEEYVTFYRKDGVRHVTDKRNGDEDIRYESVINIEKEADTFSILTEEGLDMYVEGVGTYYSPNRVTILRCVEFDFSGLKTDTKFQVMFSNMTNSKYQNDDYESLLGDYLTSKTNSISMHANSTAAASAKRVAASLLRPYIQILRAQIDEANIQSANIQELKGVWGHFETLLVDYLTVAEAEIGYAKVDLINVNMIASRDEDEHGNPTSWWNLETGEMCLGGYLISTATEYAIGSSPITPPPASDFREYDTPPTPGADEYLWQRIVMIDGAGDRHPSTPVCVNGVPGEHGVDAVTVEALSSRGLIFKHDNIATNIDVKVRNGAEQITTIAALRAAFGSAAKIVWKIKQLADSDYTTVPDNDPRISNDGFRFTMSPADIMDSVTIIYEVWA